LPKILHKEALVQITDKVSNRDGKKAKERNGEGGKTIASSLMGVGFKGGLTFQVVKKTVTKDRSKNRRKCSLDQATEGVFA